MTRAKNSVTPAERLAIYRSRRLSDGQHQAVAQRVAELVLAVPPVDAHEARVMASNVSRFLADVMPLDGGDPDGWLTEVHLARWAAQALESSVPQGTVLCVRTTIRRIIRVKDGLPGRPKRSAPSRRGRPDVDPRVLRAAVSTDSDAAAALVASLGCGLSASAARGARIVRHDDGVQVHARDGKRYAIHRDTEELAATVVGVEVTDVGWDRLVVIATDAGIKLTRQAVRDLWTISVVESLTYLELVGLRIGRKRLEWAAPKVGRPPSDTVRRLLRGTKEG